MLENQVILKVWSPDMEKSWNFHNEIIYLIIPSSYIFDSAETLYPIIMNSHINDFISVDPEINSVLVMHGI